MPERTLAEAEAEIERLHVLLNPELTYRDLEMKIRDGTIEIRAVTGPEGGNPAVKMVAAMLLHVLLCEEETMPPNYRSFEFAIKPAGEVDEIRCCAEILAPGGRTSHAIRTELEAALLGLVDAVEDNVVHDEQCDGPSACICGVDEVFRAMDVAGPLVHKADP